MEYDVSLAWDKEAHVWGDARPAHTAGNAAAVDGGGNTDRERFAGIDTPFHAGEGFKVYTKEELHEMQAFR